MKAQMVQNACYSGWAGRLRAEDAPPPSDREAFLRKAWSATAFPAGCSIPDNLVSGKGGRRRFVRHDAEMLSRGRGRQ